MLKLRSWKIIILKIFKRKYKNYKCISCSIYRCLKSIFKELVTIVISKQLSTIILILMQSSMKKARLHRVILKKKYQFNLNKCSHSRIYYTLKTKFISIIIISTHIKNKNMKNTKNSQLPIQSNQNSQRRHYANKQKSNKRTTLRQIQTYNNNSIK